MGKDVVAELHIGLLRIHRGLNHIDDFARIGTIECTAKNLQRFRVDDRL